MTETRFDEAEIRAFEARFQTMPNWTSWHRIAGDSGRDILTMNVETPKPGTVRMTKTHDGSYLATGLPGWGLTVCTSLPELLDTLILMTESRRAG